MHEEQFKPADPLEYRCKEARHAGRDIVALASGRRRLSRVAADLVADNGRGADRPENMAPVIGQSGVTQPLPMTSVLYPLASLSQIERTPSREDGIPAELEEDLRAYGCKLIHQAGILLKQ